MAGTTTPEEIWEAKKAAMPGELGPLHYHLYQKVSALFADWDEYRTLFSAENVQLLNATAPDFFGRLQWKMWAGILWHLSRLTDPPLTMNKYENLSLRQLPLHIPDPKFRAEVESLVQTAVDRTSFTREVRNKHLGHNQLPDLNSLNVSAMSAGSVKEVQEALDAIEAVMNRIELNYEDGKMQYGSGIEPPDGVDSLIYCLRLGQDEIERRDQHYST